MEVAGLAALALGLVFTSSCKEDVVEALLTALMSRWGRQCLLYWCVPATLLMATLLAL
jgi:hypothetical protein